MLVRPERFESLAELSRSETLALCERPLCHSSERGRQLDFFEPTSEERVVAYLLKVFRELDFLQILAPTESVLFDRL